MVVTLLVSTFVIAFAVASLVVFIFTKVDFIHLQKNRFADSSRKSAFPQLRLSFTGTSTEQ